MAAAYSPAAPEDPGFHASEIFPADSARFADMDAPTMTNMEHMHCDISDGEQDPVYVGLAAIEKLAHFERELRILGRESASVRKVGKGLGLRRPSL